MNSWLTKFLPGVVLGVVLQWLVGRDAKVVRRGCRER